jgi:hypothetical protein
MIKGVTHNTLKITGRTTMIKLRLTIHHTATRTKVPGKNVPTLSH